MPDTRQIAEQFTRIDGPLLLRIIRAASLYGRVEIELAIID